MCTSIAVTLNAQIARRLEEAAGILEAQHANPYRVDAYRRAALTVRNLREPIQALLEREGLEGLLKLPAIGDRLGLVIRDLILTGRFPMLEHLRGEMDPVALLQSVPGIGPVHATRLHHDLGIDTLEDLEAAAHDGRLATLAGFGPKRIAGIIDSLGARLGRVRRPHPQRPEIPVEELLELDREYREAARAGRLPKIAPRRFNPAREAWLPIMHAQRGPRHYTVLFSNTARAHRLGRTRDWVILYEDGASGGRQYTVITAQHGPLAGRRIVRGREAECRAWYERSPVNTQEAQGPPPVWAPESRSESHPPGAEGSPPTPRFPERSEPLSSDR
jgi:DNA polymerase (family 10)